MAVANPGGGDEREELRRQVDVLQNRVRELETDKNVPSKNAASEVVTPLNEADVTLRRIVQRIAMILQAEKIVVMFYDRESGDLVAIPPAIGVDEEHLKRFRVRATEGVSGEVFRESEPAIVHDLMGDPRSRKDPVALLHVTNSVTVPLVIEKRDEENRVVDRNTIGVLHAFNKKHGDDFNEEDVRLLDRMSKNVGSIIANLQLYREVVEENEELHQTFESLSAGLMLISPEGRLTQMNSSARAVFGLDADAVGKSARDALQNEDLWSLVDEAHAGTEGGKRELNVHGDRIYEAQAAQVKGEDGKDLGVVAILNDVTEMKNIDRMKSSFVAMASHELRTPLTAIKGFSSTLLDGVDDDIYSKEDQKEFLGIVVHECDRLRRLIDDLLNTARIEAGDSLMPDYGHIPLPELLDKVVKVQQQSSTKHEIKLNVHGQIPDVIVGDSDKLDQIFTNLLNNAIKYSPGGGEVIVHAQYEPATETMLFGVQDHGLGIPKEHLTKVFERFHRVNNEDNRKIYGTGLGLFLVHHLVEQVHMGKIWVDSEVGKGSTFLFRIPAKMDIDEAKAANEK
ncbi:hypothetical protein BH11ARM2_BH11ARM2_24060 [soil metagenome]